ncbi:YggS family pyridoxal phosphate-dependent enzyme [Alicyclobacillus pomorum]|uniref:YggS family pyridoxal phosphate-dependent enzyme n=1 Tax=Alicyclobacillus pomorum TaxID=204470 RepID=UPI0003F7860F|nr:YggS family pyridoxal phosphate-dependent enzyme [Alicyclobacillus pomorum]
MLADIRRTIAEACQRANRSPEEVRVIGVTKTVQPDAIAALRTAGLHDFGENRWQHAKEMLTAPGAEGATWHFIGHLQQNKVKYVVRHFSWIHSVDSLELAKAISDQAVKVGKAIHVLIQVNVSGEEQKYGLRPEQVPQVATEVSALPGLNLRGLMTMAPHTEDQAWIRSVFRGLKDLQRDLLAAGFAPEEVAELSMGMSEDFPIAVEEGASMVRIGRRLMHGQAL